MVIIIMQIQWVKYDLCSELLYLTPPLLHINQIKLSASLTNVDVQFLPHLTPQSHSLRSPYDVGGFLRRLSIGEKNRKIGG